MKKIFVFIFLSICIYIDTDAQQLTLDSTALRIIKINHADSVVGLNEENAKYQRLIGAVIIEHQGTVLTCDSAHLYQESNWVEAFSNVHINKANGADAQSDYIKYTGKDHTAFMKGNVQIIDGPNTLTTEEITYNIKTKIGQYVKDGIIQNNETIIRSHIGTYNGYTQLAHFKQSVEVNNPKYNIESDDLTYHLQSKVVKFLATSVIHTENSIIHTNSGSYDTKNSNAIFTSRTTIENEEQIVIGNKITYNDQTGNAFASGDVVLVDVKNDGKMFADKAEYNKPNGVGKATGHVIIEQEGGEKLLYANQVDFNRKIAYYKATGQVIFIDTANQIKLLSGVVEYNDFSKFMMATVFPKLITVSDGDSMFMRADTMLSYRQKDHIKLKKEKKIANNKTGSIAYVYNLLFVDSSFTALDTPTDTVDTKLIVGNRSVKLFADSMQAVCDSISYSQTDSTFRLFRNPIMWSKQQQAKADTIYLKTIANKLSEVNLKENSLLISMSPYPEIYDQVSGKYMDAYFEQNEIKHVYVNQNAESIYYAKDENDAFIGLNKAESASMDVYFTAKELDKIVMHDHPKGDFLPIDQLTANHKYLTNFKLFTDRKPQSKADIMLD